MVDELRDFKRPPAVHEVKRSNLFTSLFVIALALFLPILLAPEKKSEEFYEPEEVVEQPAEEQPLEEEPVDALEKFGAYKQKEGYPWLVKIKEFAMSYTVFGMIFRNVDKEKVKDSFGNLHDNAKAITEQSKAKQEKEE